jgi:NtrC-family two-component system response regulator AlgB
MNIRKTLAMSLQEDGHAVIAVSNAPDAVVEASRNAFDAAFVDLRLKDASGSDLIPELKASSPWIQIVIITAHGTVDSAVETMKRGAVDYIAKPFTPTQIRKVIAGLAPGSLSPNSATRRDAKPTGAKPTGAHSPIQILESQSPAMRAVVRLARHVAASDATVLIRGESGTGKGVLARAIHEWSARAGKSFATINCPTLSPELLESELFGHVKGAFTGAVDDHPGRIANSDGGTLFLDEIGDLPFALQPKLLRFVQDRQYEAVGGTVTQSSDVRLIAATNFDLEEAVAAGRFREDLLYRIKVVQIAIPPLREHPEDIVPLAEQFIVELRGSHAIRGFTPEALSALRNHPWPGNVRELRNVIERAMIFCTSTTIGLECLPDTFRPGAANDFTLGDPVPMDKLEELHIRSVLARSKTLEEAAHILRVDPTTLWRRRKKYGI